MASGVANEDSIPDELKDRLAAFDASISQLEENLKPLLSVSRTELCEKLEPLDSAKVDLLTAYTINSLFWVYLNICGQNPKDHDVKKELDGIKSYIGRVKEISDKAKAPKLDKGAAKRFVRSSLWDPAKKESLHGKEQLGEPAESTHNDRPVTIPPGKRNWNLGQSDHSVKKKK